MPETLFLFDSPPIYPALTRWTKGTPLAATVLKMHSHEVFRQNSRTREYMMNAASAAFPSFSVSTVLGPEDLDGVARRLPAFMKKPWARRWGWSLWMHGTKR